MLSDREDEIIERLQSQALKIIYGKDIKYADMRDLAGVTTLRRRRIEAVDRFAEKCSTGSWFPRRPITRSTRSAATPGVAGSGLYEEKFARCHRLYNSPLFYMRRRLNGKAGKKYGERKKEYRDQ